MSIFGDVARSVDAFRARREGRTMGEGAIGAALSLARTVGMMRDQGEAPAAWALWASLWCFFVAALSVVGGLEGLAPWAVVALLRSTYDRAQPYATRGEALNGARAVALYAAGFSGALPRPYHDAAARVVDAWSALVRAGLESAPCAWCEGAAPVGPPGRATRDGAPGPAGDPWFRYAPATAPAGGCCGACGPECPAKGPGAVSTKPLHEWAVKLPDGRVRAVHLRESGGRWRLADPCGGERLPASVEELGEDSAEKLCRVVARAEGWDVGGDVEVLDPAAVASLDAAGHGALWRLHYSVCEPGPMGPAWRRDAAEVRVPWRVADEAGYLRGLCERAGWAYYDAEPVAAGASKV